MQRACIRIKCKDICLLFSSESKSICPQRAFCLRSRGKCTFTEITRLLPSDSDLKPFYSALEVPVGEHIKEFVVRSGYYIDAIGFKTNKGKSFGLIGGNGGSLKHSSNFAMRASDHYYVDGIQGLTVVTQDAPCICEIQFKYVIVPPSDMNALLAQDSDSDDPDASDTADDDIDHSDFSEEESESDNDEDRGFEMEIA